MTIGFLLEQCFPHSSVSKESACNVGDPGSILGLGRSPGEGNGNPLQYSCLGNPMDGGAWQATVHGVARVRHDLVTKPPPPRQDPKLPPTKKLPTHQPSGKIPYKLMCCVSLVAPACNAGDPGSFPGLGRSGEGNGNLLQYSCLENPMDRGAWWATVHRVKKSWICLSA